MAGQVAAGSIVVDIAANGGEGSDVPQRIENVVVADVAGMQDMGAAGEGLHGFRPQESVRIGDDANRCMH